LKIILGRTECWATEEKGKSRIAGVEVWEGLRNTFGEWTIKEMNTC
jgi:hypothetical protein